MPFKLLVEQEKLLEYGFVKRQSGCYIFQFDNTCDYFVNTAMGDLTINYYGKDIILNKYLSLFARLLKDGIIGEVGK